MPFMTNVIHCSKLALILCVNIDMFENYIFYVMILNQVL